MRRPAFWAAAGIATTLLVGGFATGASAQESNASFLRRPVRLVPYQAAVNLIPPHFAGLKVFVYDALTNRPLPGRQIYFTTSGFSEICRAVSDTHGEASCNGPLQLSPTALDTAVNGYYATFPGDSWYDSSRVHGTVSAIADAQI
jgi:hypothetical protein